MDDKSLDSFLMKALKDDLGKQLIVMVSKDLDHEEMLDLLLKTPKEK
jgi:hypothetical protein